ncbi:cytochrome P450 4F1-like [Acanthaster planci]|uniref:Cytochrome P450 4F1-like n=1 Tax=Acanthaster planci TaxID=133434 RepID=A0A8B7ZJF4_ACAPL|nr:cytochrome P450 4F1-like [Acanthaster planci]
MLFEASGHGNKMIWQVIGIALATAFLWRVLASLKQVVSWRNAIKKLPTPSGAHWLFGHQKQRPFDPGFKWLLDTVKAFPRVYTVWLGPMPFPVLVHPETIKPLLTGAVASEKSPMYELLADWVGEGLATSKGAKWKRNRRLLTHSFHLDVLRTYSVAYNDCVEVLLGKMDQLAVQGKPIDVNHELVLATFDVILRTAFSYKSNCQLQELPKEDGLDVLSACDTMTWFIQERQFRNPFLLNPWIFRLSSDYPRYKKAFKYLRKLAKQIIEDRTKEITAKMEAGNPITKPRDFLDTLVMARDADGKGFTMEEMSDEVNSFMFAGHETTATSMTWLLYNLAKYPEHQTKIREEVKEILTDRDTDRITSKDLSRMEYMTLVIKESMRMMNAAPMISRTVTVPYKVDDVTIPAGTMVFLCLHQLNHNPSVWGQDHMEFKPSRFLPENLSQMDPFAYVPFSAGARNCIGQQFALNKIKVFVGRILMRFRLSLVDGEPKPVPQMNLVTKPVKPLYIAIEQIKGN